MILDAIDLTILKLLQDDGRMANAEIARRVSLAPSAVFERIRKLEAAGVIAGYHARLDPRRFKLGLIAFVAVKTDEPVGSTIAAQELARIPEVLEIHNVAGEDGYLCKVRVESPEALGRLLREKFGAARHVTATRSTVVLETFRESSRLPLPEANARERRRK